jgi:hypothetical protein
MDLEKTEWAIYLGGNMEPLNLFKNKKILKKEKEHSTHEVIFSPREK